MNDHAANMNQVGERAELAEVGGLIVDRFLMAFEGLVAEEKLKHALGFSPSQP